MYSIDIGPASSRVTIPISLSRPRYSDLRRVKLDEELF